MDFEKLLKLASKNQKHAEKELPQSKKYSTSLPPPKKAERPTVNPQAIRAIIEKKDKKKKEEAAEKAKKKLPQPTTKHATSTREKPKEKVEKNLSTKPKTEGSKKTTANKIDHNLKPKEHETKHKQFMNMIDKNKERKQECREPERPSRQEITKKKKPTPRPMNFKELMELAKRKQNGEVIVEAKTAKTSETLKQQTKKSTPKNDDVQKHELDRKCNRKPDSKVKVGQDSAKVKLKNGQTKGIESQEKRNGAKMNSHKMTDTNIKLKNGQSKGMGSQEKRKMVNGATTNNHKMSDTKVKDVVNGRSNNSLKKSSASRESSTINERSSERSSNGLRKSSESLTRKSSESLTSNQKAIAVLGGGKMKKPNMPPPPQHRGQVNGAPMKRKAPPPKMKVKHGRLCSDDEEDEDDDFIDDTGEDTDVSKYIRQIFGYDKRKYGYESECALGNMEASYTQIMKEESRSARLGRMEDIEDMKQEQMNLERKKAKRKR